jgi:AAA family ATP:ADP antiporter
MAKTHPNPITAFFMWISKFLFGDFEQEEFKKFVRLGVIFGLIIGSYWTLRVLKNAFFCATVGPNALAAAKIVSLFCLLPLVMLYTKLIERYSREKMLYILPAIYGAVALLFSGLIFWVHGGTDVGTACAVSSAATPWSYQLLLSFGFYADLLSSASFYVKLLGWVFYVFVESYGSLVVALFWAFLSEITMPESAKKGFPLVVALGQIGSIFGPVVIARVPAWLGHSSIAPSVFITALATLAIIPAISRFLKVTPKHLVTSYGGAAAEKHEEEPGFFEGLLLLLKHNYLLGIVFSVFAFEFISTIIDFNFQKAAFDQLGANPGLYKAFLGDYGGWVNAATLLCLLLGVSNITRILGVSIALACVPLAVGGALFGFLSFTSLNVLLWLMVGSKAINYALNGPTMKQLYIPTTNDTRFKAQAWIETFGSRGSKSGASVLNLFKGSAHYLTLSRYIGFGLVGLWFFVALYLGKTHHRAIKENKVVC